MMSSTLLCPLAERLNINSDSRSGGGGSQQTDRVGFLFNKPNQLSGEARREGLSVQLESFSFFKLVREWAIFLSS